MRVLLLSQYFTPEVTAASLRLEPVARGLAERGHEVEVVCEVPNHPSGLVATGYRRRLRVTERRDGYTVNHIWVRATPSKRARARVASYASYAAGSALFGSTRRCPDVVLASSPPLSVGAAGLLVAQRFRRPLAFDVRDLWPEIALSLGELRPGRIADAAARLERRLYRSAALVTTPTAPFAEHIAAIAGDPGKVQVIANGTTAEWLAAGEEPPDRQAAGLGEDFTWTYAGNIGLSQNLESAIDAAAALGDGFRLLLLGDGTSRDRLRAYAENVGAADRVEFRDSVPPQQARTIMRASDALLVSLAGTPELGRSVPVKLYDSCAVGRPVIAAVGGEALRLAREADAALLTAPGDAGEIAAAVRRVREEPGLAQRMGEAGRRFAAANLREDAVGLLERRLARLAQGAGR